MPSVMLASSLETHPSICTEKGLTQSNPARKRNNSFKLRKGKIMIKATTAKSKKTRSVMGIRLKLLGTRLRL